MEIIDLQRNHHAYRIASQPYETISAVCGKMKVLGKKVPKKSQLSTPPKTVTLKIATSKGVTEKVITMAQAEYIKYLWEGEDRSLREIAQITNLNFRTVQKYAKKEDWSEGSKRSAGIPSYRITFLPSVQ